MSYAIAALLRYQIRNPINANFRFLNILATSYYSIAIGIIASRYRSYMEILFRNRINHAENNQIKKKDKKFCGVGMIGKANKSIF
ncbi:hypothetical protein KDV38_17020 [Providencia rettgeri]